MVKLKFSPKRRVRGKQNNVYKIKKSYSSLYYSINDAIENSGDFLSYYIEFFYMVFNSFYIYVFSFYYPFLESIGGSGVFLSDLIVNIKCLLIFLLFIFLMVLVSYHNFFILLNINLFYSILRILLYVCFICYVTTMMTMSRK